MIAGSAHRENRDSLLLGLSPRSLGACRCGSAFALKTEAVKPPGNAGSGPSADYPVAQMHWYWPESTSSPTHSTKRSHRTYQHPRLQSGAYHA
jgi:hypothetical protein